MRLYLLTVTYLSLLGQAVMAQPITEEPWTEAVISVTSLERSAAFFTRIGDYQQRFSGPLSDSEIAAWGLPESASGEVLLLGHQEHQTGMVRLVRFDNAGPKTPMRPGSRTWDTGCYFSLMVRAKNLQGVYNDAIKLGWWTETPVTDVKFGASRLKVVIFRGPDGVQVQAYERLEPPLPAEIGPFDRLTRPFNAMQMVRDRDVAYQFFTELLGFDTFYLGKPYVADSPRPTPLGIPINLTTSVRYRAGIVYPTPGEFGRMEMIEVMDLDGQDYAHRCNAPNLGILAIRYPVANARQAADLVLQRGGTLERHLERDVARILVAPHGPIDLFSVKTPDGALIQFYSLGQPDGS